MGQARLGCLSMGTTFTGWHTLSDTSRRRMEGLCKITLSAQGDEGNLVKGVSEVII